MVQRTRFYAGVANGDSLDVDSVFGSLELVSLQHEVGHLRHIVATGTTHAHAHARNTAHAHAHERAMTRQLCTEWPGMCGAVAPIRLARDVEVVPLELREELEPALQEPVVVRRCRLGNR